MAASTQEEHGEEALRVVLKHLGVMTANAIAGYFDGQLLTEENAPLSEELQVALRNVAARDAHAVTVARLACERTHAPPPAEHDAAADEGGAPPVVMLTLGPPSLAPLGPALLRRLRHAQA
jgi:hypothetical protein